MYLLAVEKVGRCCEPSRVQQAVLVLRQRRHFGAGSAAGPGGIPGAIRRWCFAWGQLVGMGTRRVYLRVPQGKRGVSPACEQVGQDIARAGRNGLLKLFLASLWVTLCLSSSYCEWCWGEWQHGMCGEGATRLRPSPRQS